MEKSQLQKESPNLCQRMLLVTRQVQGVEKKGWNEFSKYAYVRAVDVIAEVQKALVENGVCLQITELDYLETRKKENEKNSFATLKSQATFINADNPEDKFTVEYFSQAADTLDKHIYKAKTNGLKYLLTQQFMIVTDLIVDAEEDRPEKKIEPQQRQMQKPTAIKNADDIVKALEKPIIKKNIVTKIIDEINPIPKPEWVAAAIEKINKCKTPKELEELASNVISQRWSVEQLEKIEAVLVTKTKELKQEK